jgi:hypothetical protein
MHCRSCCTDILRCTVNRTVQYCVDNSQLLVTNLNQINPIHTLPSHSFKMKVCNIATCYTMLRTSQHATQCYVHCFITTPYLLFNVRTICKPIHTQHSQLHKTCTLHQAINSTIQFSFKMKWWQLFICMQLPGRIHTAVINAMSVHEWINERIQNGGQQQVCALLQTVNTTTINTLCYFTTVSYCRQHTNKYTNCSHNNSQHTMLLHNCFLLQTAHKQIHKPIHTHCMSNTQIVPHSVHQIHKSIHTLYIKYTTDPHTLYFKYTNRSTHNVFQIHKLFHTPYVKTLHPSISCLCH